jgi:hypothetical protein
MRLAALLATLPHRRRERQPVNEARLRHALLA